LKTHLSRLIREECLLFWFRWCNP